MTGYHWLEINSVSDYDRLSSVLGEEYAPSIVIDQLKNGISPAVHGILLETEYIDKDYRSTYYGFYSKKARAYSPDCVRLHFFDEGVRFREDTLDLEWPPSADSKKPQPPLDEYYRGFMVLRPTLVSTIGRSVLSPDIRNGAGGAIISAWHRVHVLGRSLRVRGFPSMDQHTDIAVCAHAACWSILRHYSERYPHHRERLVQEITQMAHQFDPGGLVPSKGLDVYQAERVFQAADTFPIIVAKGPKPARFYRQLLAYLESGFPLFVAMDADGHAVAAIGHSWAAPKPPSKNEDHAWSQVEKIVVVDDNHLPYFSVPTNASEAEEYSTTDFTEFIVALPDKIFYPAEAMERHSIRFMNYFRKYFPFPGRDKLVRRYFITTISGLREYYRKNFSQFGEKLVRALMELRTAQFVWVVEYSSFDQWSGSTVAVRVIVDATASPRDPNPVWFAHSAERAVFFDRSSVTEDAEFFDTSSHGAALSRMERNLRPIVPRN